MGDEFGNAENVVQRMRKREMTKRAGRHAHSADAENGDDIQHPTPLLVLRAPDARRKQSTLSGTSHSSTANGDRIGELISPISLTVCRTALWPGTKIGNTPPPPRTRSRRSAQTAGVRCA